MLSCSYEHINANGTVQEKLRESLAISVSNSRNAVFIRSHDAVIRVYDGAGNVIETHEHAGDFKEW
jgi:hypothetical protein